MIWLIGLIVLLQISFLWFLKPLTLFATPIMEFRGFTLLLLIAAAWLLTGRGFQKLS